jgi:hypothetical protein
VKRALNAPALAAAVLVLAAGCSVCGKRTAGPTGPLTRYLPKDVDAAVVVPDLRILGDRVGIVSRLKIASFLAGTQGFANADELVNSLVGNLGLDVRNAQALEAAGVDPAGGIAVAFLSGDRVYSVVVVKDPAALAKTMAALARTRMGAGLASTRSEGGVELTGYSTAVGAAPRFGYALREGVALIAAGPSVAGLPQWAALAPAASLESEAPLQGSLQRLGGKPDAYAYAPATSSYVRPYALPGVTVVGALTATALTVRADLPWPNTRASLEVLDKKDGPDVLSLLPPDAFAVARFWGEPSGLAPYWEALAGPYVGQAAHDAQFDVKGELLDNLKPGAAVALGVAPTARLGAGVPELDVRRTNPFGFFWLVAAGKAKETARAQATLEKVPAFARRFGAHVSPSERRGQKVFLTSYSQGEGTDFALVGDTWLLAAPVNQLDAALSRMATGAGGPGPVPDPQLRAALGASGASAVVDLRQLTESVKALPSESWGIGGFAMKATTVRWLDATDDLRAVTGSLSRREGAVEAEVSLRLAPK